MMMDHAETEPRPLRRVLIVDDDRLLRSQATMVLQAEGYDVLEAVSGETALDRLECEPIDLVLMEIHMRGIDGFETCRRIREREPDEVPLIILTTTNDYGSVVQNAFESGATDFVAKPINWTVLKHRLRLLLNARRVTRELSARADYLDGLLNTLQDTVLVLDAAGRVIASRRAVDGSSSSDALFAVGRPLHECLPPSVTTGARRALASIRNGDVTARFDFEIAEGAAAGCYEIRLASCRQEGIVAMVRDLTESRRSEAQIRRLAHSDPVTGLPNRARLQQLVEVKVRELDVHSRLMLVHVELQGLDYARNLLGEEKVLELMQLVGQQLRGLPCADDESKTATSCLIGRISESVFAVVREIPNPRQSASGFAEAVLAGVTRKYRLGEFEINVSARLGVEILGRTLDPKVGEAFDHAATAAGEADNGLVFYTDRLSERRRERAALVKDLQSAVNNGDLHVEYQPKVDTVGHDLVGVEALVRWHHPTRGPVPPSTFIPLAEENGLIQPIGQLVLETACRQSDYWVRQRRRVVPIAVNFSGRQFVKKGLLDGMLETLARHNIGSNEIEIELTETVAMERGGIMQEALRRLQDIGIRTAIDDFGMGYSSLENLRRFRFHTLKIDRSFVADLGRDPSARSVVRGIISMGHALGMQVVAEGVEQRHQLNYLRDEQCDVIQGFLTGRPMPGDEIEPLLGLAGSP